MNVRALVFGVSLMVSAVAGGQQPNVQLYAAGSLRSAMTEIVQAVNASGGPAANATDSEGRAGGGSAISGIRQRFPQDGCA
jgi:ABC-type molybdate transport system substrate-binding protein